MFTEGKTCDAILRVLERRENASRQALSKPEAAGTNLPPIDFHVMLGPQGYAIEHTGIEPFEKLIESDLWLQPILTLIRASLPARLPGVGRYGLSFARVVKVKRRHIESTARAIADWVLDSSRIMSAPIAHAKDRNYYPSGIHRMEEFRNNGYVVRLYHHVHWAVGSRHDGILLPGRAAPPDLENQRRQRIQRALPHKLENLRLFHERSSRTILVLETRDGFSHEGLICAALQDILPGATYQPDEIYCASVYETSWTIGCLLRDGEWGPDEDQDTDHHTEFDGEELVDLNITTSGGFGDE